MRDETQETQAIGDVRAAMKAAGCDAFHLSEAQRRDLKEQGYCRIEAGADYWRARGIALDALEGSIERLIAAEGTMGGHDGKQRANTAEDYEPGAQRLSNLPNKDSLFRRLLADPYILDASFQIIGGEMKFSSATMREPKPGQGEQKIHVDWTPRDTETTPFAGCIAYLYLDDSTPENGALRVIPGSHRRLGPPEAQMDVRRRSSDEIQVPARRGDLIVMNIQTWHAGAANVNGDRRRVIAVNYRRRRLRQQLNQRKFLSQEVRAALSPLEAYLLAVRPDDPSQALQDWVYAHRRSWYMKAPLALRAQILARFGAAR